MDGVPGRVLPGRRTGPVGAQTALARVELPCFDLSCFATGAEGSPARESLAGALDEALSRTGFFLVTGHGIEPRVRRAMFAAAEAFFSEPLEVKRRPAIGNSPAHRGYVRIGAESLDDTGRGDAKESLDTGGEQGPDHPEVVAGTPLFGPNQWPRTPGFREPWERYFAQAVEAAAPARRRRRRRPPGDAAGGNGLEVGVPEDALVVNLGDPAVQRRHLLHRNLPRPG
jgi:hypothetical protein